MVVVEELPEEAELPELELATEVLVATQRRRRAAAAAGAAVKVVNSALEIKLIFSPFQ